MKYRVITFCFLFLTFRISAADTWVKTYQPFGDGDYYVEDVVVCDDGGFAVNGFYYYFDDWTEVQWGYLMKTDSAGNFLWAKEDTVSFMSENESLAFIQTLDSCYISAVSSPWNSALIKRDSQGNRIWSIPNDFHVESMTKTEDGNIVLGGVTTDDGYPGIRKITEEGNILWTQDYYLSGSGIGRINSVIETSDGGFAATGYTSGNGFDLFVLKTDANGDSLWSVIYDGFGGWDEGNSITQNINNDLLVCGIVDASPPIYSYGFLAMLDAEGDTLWTKYVDSSIGYEHFSVISLSDNSFTASCNSSEGAKFYNFYDNYIVDWISNLQGWIAQGDKGLKHLPDNGYIIGGTYQWTSNIMLVKADSLGQYLDTDHHDLPLSSLECFPNPLNLTTMINFTLQRESNIVLKIYNVKGQLLKTLINEKTQAGKYSIMWDARDYSTGNYFIRLENKYGATKISKVLLLK